jgi:hypothetical protein
LGTTVPCFCVGLVEGQCCVAVFAAKFPLFGTEVTQSTVGQECQFGGGQVVFRGQADEGVGVAHGGALEIAQGDELVASCFVGEDCRDGRVGGQSGRLEGRFFGKNLDVGSGAARRHVKLKRGEFTSAVVWERLVWERVEGDTSIVKRV